MQCCNLFLNVLSALLRIALHIYSVTPSVQAVAVYHLVTNYRAERRIHPLADTK